MVVENMVGELGLRERKKLRTRQLIAQTARGMFVEHGFDAVSVAAVARAAEVSETTVFNYFPTKEDLVLQGIEVYEAEVLSAIRDRPTGESIMAAFTRFQLDSRWFLATDDEEATRHRTELNRIIAGSPALLAREREIFAGHVALLAELIATETRAEPDDLRPWVVAHSLVGAQQTVLAFIRRRILAGVTDHTLLVRDTKTESRRALALLEDGLAAYGPAV